MSPLEQALLFSFLAGFAIPVGGAIAAVERIRPEWLEQEFRHGVIAFGGGTLLAAVALVLVPEGAKKLSIMAAAICFLSGGVVFLFVDRWFAARKTPASMFLAMLMDFLPEAVALGAAFATGEPTALLLAFLIALQNAPEGFNAFREAISSTTFSSHRILAIFVALSFLGPLSAFLGIIYFVEHQALLGGLMMFCAGGILYLSFQDIAPAAKLEQHWLPALGAVVGFSLGIIGYMFTHG